MLTGDIDAQRLRRICEEEAALTLGMALEGAYGGGFRIGHMGHLNPPMILGTLGTIEAALAAMEAPIGRVGGGGGRGGDRVRHEGTPRTRVSSTGERGLTGGRRA